MCKMARKRLFGTSGIRGVTNKDITSALALQIGESFGALMRVDGGSKRLCTARDTRAGASSLQFQAGCGLMAQGHDVVDCGCIPMPAFANWLAAGNGDGGIMITGSHLPANMIGIIPVMGDGAYIPDDKARKVEQILHTRSYETDKPVDCIGMIKKAHGVMGAYRDKLLSLVNPKPIQAHHFHVGVDPVNGTTAGFLAELLSDDYGCEVVEINGEQSSDPGRSPEPRAGTLGELMNAVKSNDLDIAAGLDIDADRVVFIDENGIPISEDITGIIFADRELKKDDWFVTPVNSSGIVEWFGKKKGAKVKYCRIGQPSTVEAINKQKAKYSYEESGKYYFTRQVNWCDGPLAVLKMLEILSKQKKPFSKIVKAYPGFYQIKKRKDLPPQRKDEIMAEIHKQIKWELGSKKTRMLDIDGYKIMYPDDSWLLIRASGTEPVLRIFADARKRKKAETIIQAAEDFVENIINK
jgi:phosphomannomutase/phosphoglucomutase